MKVLFVEGRSRRQAKTGADLREPGYSIDFVSEADRAIALAASRDYDVVILDLIPPREKSLRVLHEIRESNSDIGILVLTGREQIHDRVTALIQGADDFLLKPCSTGDLQERIVRLLRPASGRASISGVDCIEVDHSAHKNRLIADLLDQCHCDRGPIELLISEIKPAVLLDRVRAELDGLLRQRGARVQLPGGKPPTLLCDAGLIHHLLVKLLSYAVHLAPAGAVIAVDLQPDDGYCTLSIEGPLSEPSTGAQPADLFRGPGPRVPGPAPDRSAASLSLARNYAESLNLELRARRLSNAHLRIELSRIKVV